MKYFMAKLIAPQIQGKYKYLLFTEVFCFTILKTEKYEER